MDSPYFIGRASSNLEAPFEGRDKIFASQRIDGQKVSKATFEHCTFGNISFKEVDLADSRFIDCAFVRCYFRKTRLTTSHFIGCKFVDCDFPKIRIDRCSFSYSRFEGCFVPYEQMLTSLPREPNL